MIVINIKKKKELKTCKNVINGSTEPNPWPAGINVGGKWE